MDDDRGNGDDAIAVRITNREIWTQLQHVDGTVARLVGRVDSVLSENTALRKSVRQLELKFYGLLAGVVGALGLIAAAVWGA